MGYREEYFKKNPGLMGKHLCMKCMKWYDKKDIDVDHIIPQSKGGTDDVYNLQGLCYHCNRSKQDDTSETVQDFALNVGKNIIQDALSGNIKKDAAQDIVKTVGQSLLKGAMKNILK